MACTAAACCRQLLQPRPAVRRAPTLALPSSCTPFPSLPLQSVLDSILKAPSPSVAMRKPAAAAEQGAVDQPPPAQQQPLPAQAAAEPAAAAAAVQPEAAAPAAQPAAPAQQEQQAGAAATAERSGSSPVPKRQRTSPRKTARLSPAGKERVAAATGAGSPGTSTGAACASSKRAVLPHACACPALGVSPLTAHRPPALSPAAAQTAAAPGAAAEAWWDPCDADKVGRALCGCRLSGDCAAAGTSRPSGASCCRASLRSWPPHLPPPPPCCSGCRRRYGLPRRRSTSAATPRVRWKAERAVHAVRGQPPPGCVGAGRQHAHPCRPMRPAGSLPLCRERQAHDVSAWLQQLLHAGRGGSIYLSGLPGTGGPHRAAWLVGGCPAAPLCLPLPEANSIISLCCPSLPTHRQVADCTRGGAAVLARRGRGRRR